MTKSTKIKPGLGKGLGALIPSVEFSTERGFTVSKDDEDNSIGIFNIEISKIRAKPYQPRQDLMRMLLTD